MSMTTPSDVYLRCTDAQGCIHHSEHRCWDAEIFLASRAAEAGKENTKYFLDTGVTGRAKIEQLTVEQFKRRA